MKDKVLKYSFYVLLLLGFLFLIMFVSSGIFANTDEVRTCVKCHVMEEPYLNLVKGGLHNSVDCVECHLPKDSKTGFYLWKIVFGGKDYIVFYTGRVPERIQIKGYAEKIIQRNCIICHEGMVSMIKVLDRNCWDCHKRASHKQTGLRDTI